MIVISVTSSITNLFQIGLLELLHRLFGDIYISPAVRRELYALPDQGEEIDDIEWIKIKYPTDQKLINKLLEDLDLGESESIALAIEYKADYLIIDEFLGRKIAEAYNVKIIGVLGVLIQSKEKGYIESVQPFIKKLREIGFRLNQNLVDKVLKRLGEL